MKTTLHISLRQAATAILLFSYVLMSSQNVASVKKMGESDHFFPTMGTGRAQEGAGLLSIDLVEFSAVNNEGRVNLTWVTRSEKVGNFLIERSDDGLNWEVMALNIEVKSSDAHYYNSVDPSPCNKEISYYRLKQTGLRGDDSYSDIVAVEMEKQVKLKLYPNPAVSYIQIISDCKTTRESTVCFYNATGHLVKKITGDINTMLIDVMDLEAGNYYALINAGTKASRIQFVKN